MSATEFALPQELHALYSNDHGWLYGWLRKKGGTTHGAADLAHDAFPGLRSSKEAVATQKPRPVLTAVTQRALSNWHREQLKRINLEDREARRGFGVRAGRSCGGIGSAAQPRRFELARAHFSVSPVKSRESDEA